jgi:hypothetical protein
MRRSSAASIVLAAWMAALAASCSAPQEPASGDTRAKQERERDPAANRNGGGY